MHVLIAVAVVVGGCALVVLVLDMTVFRWISDSHRRNVPQEAWGRARVNGLRWGLLGTNIYLPYSNIYYVLRVLPALDKAAADEDGHAPSS